MGDTKISPHSLNDLKNTTDDCLGNYLRSLSFTQDNNKLDFRLAVGYTAVVIAAVTFIADYKLGWEATKTGTAVAVVAYAALNAVYTYWMWLVEKGIVFEGQRLGQKLSISSQTKKHDPTYYLAVITSDSSQSLELSCPFTTWFTADGYFVAQPFQQWLANNIDVIGGADQKNATNSKREDLVIPEVEANGIASTTGATLQQSKGSKKNKRKG